MHPTTFSLKQFYGIAFSPNILLGQLSKVVFQHFLFEAILRNCILKIFPSRQLSRVVLYKSFLEEILRNCILKIFTSRQLSRVVSPNFVLEQLYKVVFPQYFFQENSTELYYQNISFEVIRRNCILKTFHLRQLCGIVFLQHFLFETILRNCILKTFLLRQFCRIIFSKYSLWGNSAKLYSQNISFEATLQSCIPILSF